MKVAVIGAGAWGTALSIVSARGGADVVLWSYDGEYKHFDNVEMPENIQVSTDLAVVGDCDTWLIVTPAAFFRETMRKASTFYNNQPVIVCTKGAESTTGNFMSEIIADDASMALFDDDFRQQCRVSPSVFHTNTCDSYLSCMKMLAQRFGFEQVDVIGTEICGVGKNAVALICGYNSVAAAGENERALIFTRAWNEVMEIGLRSGAKMHSFLDLCGIGDLFLSATSATSRNFAGGMAIANGMPPSGTVEGIFALDGLIRRAENVGVDVPTLREMQIKLGLKK